MAEQTALRAQRLGSLTSLRFPAALAVFASHAAGTYDSGPSHRLLRQGFVGVSFFFILSGFVLAWSTREGDRIGSFYRRRFARVWPAHAATWVAAGVTAIGAVTAGGAVLSLVLLQAWVPSERVYFTMNPPSWSLSCEAFFYLLFPVLIRPAVAASSRARWAVMGGAVTAMVAVAVAVHPAVAGTTRYWFLYIFPLVRLLEFIIGMCLALQIRAGWRPPVGLAPAGGLVAGAYVLAGFVPIAFALTVVTVIPFSLLIAAGASSDLAGGRWLHARWLSTLGVWSYGFYLVHVLVLRVVGTIVRPNAPRAAISLVLSVAAAAVLYRLVEHPAERRIRGQNRPPGVAAPGAGPH